MMDVEWQEHWDDSAVQGIPLEAIALDDAQLAQASHWSTRGFGAAQQWQIYRNGLALLGLKQWLLDRGIQEPLCFSKSTLFESVMANLLDGVAQISVGSIQVSLCVRDFEQAHQFPVLFRHHEPFWAHLYLWVDVWEETGQVAIASGLWHQNLILSAQPLEADWSIEIPASEAFLDPDQILLALRCVNVPEPLTSSPQSNLISPPLTTTHLEAKLQRWTELTVCSEVLSSQEGMQILRSPELSQCFEKTLQQTFHPSLFSGINLGEWWSETLEAVRVEMGWVRLPRLALRSQSPENAAIVGRLLQQGIEIPSQAGVSYQDLSFASQALRLYTVAWPHSIEDNESDWSLLIALCNVPFSDLSQPVKFEIKDANKSLAHEHLQPKEANACRYIQVTGGREELFWVTLTDLQHPDATLTLPPFFFTST